jgi:small GTP-binding protein
VWDTAGQERFKSLIPSYIRDANAIVLVYDQSKLESYNGLDSWIAFIKEHRRDNSTVLLLANKSDHPDKLVR